MIDLYNIMFDDIPKHIDGEKGNFITKDNRVIFVNGPGAGSGGGASQQVLDTTGATMMESDLDRMVRGMTDAELAQSNSEVQHRYSELGHERDNTRRFIDLQKENIPESHARNLMLSIYPQANIGSQNTWQDLTKHLNLVEEQMDDMLPIIKVVRRENIRRGIIKVKS